MTLFQWEVGKGSCSESCYRLMKFQCSFMEVKDVLSDPNNDNNEVRTLIPVLSISNLRAR